VCGVITSCLLLFYRALVGNLREGDHLEERGIEGRIILNWILEK
jgi:hypothetical protein